MRFSSILSVRNVLRASGTLSILLGAPLLLVPAAGVSLLLGDKRPGQLPGGTKSVSVVAQSLGVACTASGLKSVLAVPTRTNLSAALFQDALFLVLHVHNRVRGTWKEAGHKPRRSTVAIASSAVAVLVQGGVLLHSKLGEQSALEELVNK